MPWVRVWIHFVWSTKNREPYLDDEIRQEVFAHIRKNARAKNTHIDSINGHVDHVHCLVSLGTDQTIEKIMQLIKGESSFWINKSGLCKTSSVGKTSISRFPSAKQMFQVSENISPTRKNIIGRKVLKMNLKAL